MKYNSNFQIGAKTIDLIEKPYFIADIAANHDGNLNKAIDLIHLSAEAGSDAAKFQHFKAETIVSDIGFKKIGKIAEDLKTGFLLRFTDPTKEFVVFKCSR